MNNYIKMANSNVIYLIVGLILAFVVLFCIVFIVRSYRAGVSMGMDKNLLKKTITSSATFTAIPSISILLGVLALAGTLGVPIAWLRLSVIGNLQYEATVAQIAAEGMGKSLISSMMNMDDLVTILLAMSVGIIWGCVLSVLFLKPYTNKLSLKNQKIENNENSFAPIAMVALFIGLCSAFLGNYVSNLIINGIKIPVFTAIISAIVMAIFEFLIKEKGHKSLESFSLALSMIASMSAAAIISKLFGGM